MAGTQGRAKPSPLRIGKRESYCPLPLPGHTPRGGRPLTRLRPHTFPPPPNSNTLENTLLLHGPLGSLQTDTVARNEARRGQGPEVHVRKDDFKEYVPGVPQQSIMAD